MNREACPACGGNGYVDVVAERRRKVRQTRRPATKRSDPVISGAEITAWVQSRTERIEDWTPQLVDTVVRTFREVCAPDDRLPLSRQELSCVVQRLHGYALQAEQQGLPQSEWRKLNLCASDLLALYKGGAR